MPSRFALAGLGVLAVIAVLFGARALTPSRRNLLTNSSFRGSPVGWVGWNGPPSRITPGRSDSGALRIVSTTAARKAGSFGAYTDPRPVVGLLPGDTYRGSAWIRTSTPGQLVCLVLREWSTTSEQVGRAQSCMHGSTEWQRFPTVSYTTRSHGSELQLIVVQRPRRGRNSFDLDQAQLLAAND